MSDNASLTAGRVLAVGKRSQGDSAAPQNPPRQKRGKYTTVACDECKKRKIKCSGDIVCQRCQSYGIQCHYAPQPSTDNVAQTTRKKVAEMDADIRALQTQVRYLLASVKQIQGQDADASSIMGHEHSIGGVGTPYSTPYPSNGQHSPRPKQPQFLGPTNPAFSFSVANSTLHSMGLQAEPECEVVTDSVVPSRRNSPEPSMWSNSRACDPLCGIEVSEILRLLEVYKEEIFPIYPFIDFNAVIEQAPRVYDDIQAAPSPSISKYGNQWTYTTQSKDARILKMLVASSLVLEGLGRSNLSHLLLDSVECSRTPSTRERGVDLKEIQILTIMSIYYFHCDEEVLAWRTIGYAARMALEMGLHRKEGLVQNFPNAEDQVWAVRLFWCIYVLDRRWSFGTGMPFALQDSDIDPELPIPGPSVPYLECLAAYGKLCSKVWHAVAGYEAKGIEKDTVDYLDFQIKQWIQSIPPDFQLLAPLHGHRSSKQSQILRRLRILLHVRGNHLRILIHRQNVLSATNITRNLAGARTVTDIARDTIRVLVDLNKTSDIYHTQQNAFNYFLVSALAAIFLAVCHAPAEFSHACRNEFYNALDLVKSFSSRSIISRRLWRSVRKLKDVAPHLGLPSNEQPASRTDEIVSASTPFGTDTLPPLVNGFTGSGNSLHVQEGASLEEPVGNYVTSIWSLEDPKSVMTMPSVSVPDMSEMSNDLTAFFEAFGQVNPGVVQQPQQGYGAWEPTSAFESGGEISRLFESLL